MNGNRTTPLQLMSLTGLLPVFEAAILKLCQNLPYKIKIGNLPHCLLITSSLTKYACRVNVFFPRYCGHPTYQPVGLLGGFKCADAHTLEDAHQHGHKLDRSEVDSRTED